MPKSAIQLSSKRVNFLTLGLICFGIILVVSSSLFFIWARINTDNLSSLNVQKTNTSTSLASLYITSDEQKPQLQIPRKMIYPGARIPFRQWADPRGTVNLGQERILQGFTPANSYGQPFFSGDSSKAERMLIPALGIDVPVKDLAILNLGKSLEYETPAHTVGHIPGTSNPGSQGNGWYFGHLESPIMREGNVFARLPQIPTLIANGEEVLVIVESATDVYLYTIVETKVVTAEELELFNSSDARITLVTCQPRGTYDHRLLVSGTLIGFRKLLDPL